MKKPQIYLCLLALLLSFTVTAQQDNEDQVIADDLIVNGGSIAVGFDAANGEAFGFDTIRLKENNLRIHFDDTSASASFPGNDWRIEINDTDNGGANFFRVSDATAGTNPFSILAGAGNNALFINASGNVGFGNAAPAVELHVTDGDTPTMRIEQNGASGFTPQTWDVAGNETNFFVRDATNGSTLPFRIRPGAPTSSIDIAATGSVGIGNQTPNANASLDLGATNKALLLNRVTTVGRADLVTAGAVAGMLVYDTDENKTYYFDGTNWVDPAGDNQNLSSATLSGTTLTVAIEDGTSVDVDLAPILAPLQTLIDDLTTRVDALEACACTTLTTPDNDLPSETGIQLNQNIPNPFNSNTIIEYYIPNNYSSAKIQVVSSLGQVIYSIPITQFGEGSVTLQKNNLQSAVYFYTLYVDGKKIDTKRLVVE